MNLEEEFDLFLKKKRIDPEKFKKGEPIVYQEFCFLFSQVHPNSFVTQKLNLINNIRRKYHLEEGV
jgi:hypothetical protein